jgi:hypothetical protein
MEILQLPTSHLLNPFQKKFSLVTGTRRGKKERFKASFKESQRVEGDHSMVL